MAPDEREGSLWINQNAYLSLADLSKDQELNYEMKESGNGVYLFVIEGKINTAGEELETRDAVALSEANELSLKATADSQVLVIEVPIPII